jgi:hypothetical protein
VKVVTDGAGHDVPSSSKEETNGMRKITQANETTDERSTGVVTSEGTPTIGSGTTFIGDVLRLARLRARKAVAGRDLKGTGSLQDRRSDHGSDVARSSMEAGLTRGASLLFGEFGSRR